MVQPEPLSTRASAAVKRAIFLSTFVLTGQNHETQLSERRNNLDLQINWLTEQDNTKLLRMLERIAGKIVRKQGRSQPPVLDRATHAERLVEQIEKLPSSKRTPISLQRPLVCRHRGDRGSRTRGTLDASGFGAHLIASGQYCSATFWSKIYTYCMKGLVFWREDPDTTNPAVLESSKGQERGQVGWRRLLGILIVALSCSQATLAYSVLTHEEIVDLVWEDQIRALLVSRFPGLSEDQIREAHAHAYGGSVIQDLGYYPFGSKDFSNLVHYVRSGDFVHELLRQSQDANEYAFALGALAHYTSDVAGHPAVNHAVAMLYPKLQSKFGNSVRFAQGKSAHLRTEFGFDVAQVAKRRYASEQYHDFIGFKVSKPLLKRTFPIVYGLEMKDVLANDDLAISSYRFAVSTLIPRMTKIALQSHKKELMQETTNFDKQKFLYRLSRADYEKKWGKDYRKPGFGTVVLATILRCMPKVGPFKALAFKPPTPQTEALYFKSLNTTVDHYRAFLKQVGTDSLQLRNCDLDTGEDTRAAEYPSTDDAFAKLVAKLADRKFDLMTPSLRDNILRFYSDLSTPIATKKDRSRWQSLLAELHQLKSARPAQTLASNPVGSN